MFKFEHSRHGQSWGPKLVAKINYHISLRFISYMDTFSLYCADCGHPDSVLSADTLGVAVFSQSVGLL